MLSWFGPIRFWLLLVLSIPSILCSLLIFVYFYRRRHKLTIHHHITLVLIILSFLQTTTDIPFAISYYQRGEVAFPSDAFCLWWTWWDYVMSAAPIFAMAWASIERHLLIFHTTLMSTRRKRWCFHVLPMLVACLYPLVFYTIAILLNSCENAWDYTMVSVLARCAHVL
jgi:hypothetical protein